MAYSYKCPNCSASLVFDPDIRRMVCGFCDAKISPHDIVLKDELEEGFVVGEQWTDATVYNCENCGAEVIVGENALTDTCIYCDTKIILTKRLEAGAMPTKIITFRFGKQRALEECSQRLSKRKFLPSKFVRQIKFRGLKGIYIPVWLYDYPVDIDFGYHQDEAKKTARGLLLWEGVPINASLHINQDLFERIEPFNYKYLQKFEAQYLSGFMAEKANINYEKLSLTGFTRVKECVDIVLRATLRYDYDKPYSDSNLFYKGKAKLVLLPIWFVDIDYKNKRHRVVINGQTGAMAADLPRSKLRVALLAIVLWLLITLPVLFFIVAIWRVY